MKYPKFSIGDVVDFDLEVFDLNRKIPMYGTIIALHPHGFGDYLVIEYYAGVDFCLVMKYCTLVKLKEK